MLIYTACNASGQVGPEKNTRKVAISIANNLGNDCPSLAKGRKLPTLPVGNGITEAMTEERQVDHECSHHPLGIKSSDRECG